MIYKTLLGEEINMEVEIWKSYKTKQADIEISNFGNVRGTKWHGKKFEPKMVVISEWPNKGHRMIGSKHWIYRMVWELFNGPIPKRYVIHHIDENPANDRLDNLECIPLNKHSTLHATENYDPDILSFKGHIKSKEERQTISERQKGAGNNSFGRKWVYYQDKFKYYAKPEELEYVISRGFEIGFKGNLKMLNFGEILEYFINNKENT